MQFVNCGETIKQEIKEETEIDDESNPLADPLTVKTNIVKTLILKVVKLV